MVASAECDAWDPQLSTFVGEDGKDSARLGTLRDSTAVLTHLNPLGSPGARRNPLPATGEIAILTLPIMAVTVVRALTNPRIGKIKFMNAMADRAQ